MTKSTIGQSQKSSSTSTRTNGTPTALTSRRKAKAGLISAEHPVEHFAEARSRQLLSAIMAFRDGDFSVRLPADWEGTDGRIAEAFNQSLAHEGRISREVARLSETVGKEGRLKQRMTLPGAGGGGAEEVESLNTL